MSGQNDVVFVKQEVLWQGMRSGLAKSTLRRIRWSKTIDHFVLYVTVPLEAVQSQETVPRVKSAVQRFRLPDSLLNRARLMQIIGTQHDETMRDDPCLSASGAWTKMGEVL